MSVYKRTNGKWYGHGSINGKRYHICLSGATNLKEAKALDDGYRYNLRLEQEGLKKEKVEYTFSFLMDRYLEYAKVNTKSVYEAEKYSRKLTEFFGKNKKISEIKPLDVERFRTKMLSEGYSNATVNRYFSGLKKAFNVLIKSELIDYNPTNALNKLTENNRRYRYLTRDEWLLLQDYLPDYLYNIVVVALNTGLRKQNVLLLRWEQINFDLNIIELCKQENKGKKHLFIPITKTFKKFLLGLKPQKEGYVFVNPKTGLPYRDVKKGWTTALKKAGIKDFHFHDLRRTMGTWLKDEGVDLVTIQGLLGHSELRTTERYLVPTIDNAINAVDKLDKYVF